MALIGQAVSEKKIFENGGRRRTDDGRMPDHGHPISSPCEPSGSRELKNSYKLILSYFVILSNFRNNLKELEEEKLTLTTKKGR